MPMISSFLDDSKLLAFLGKALYELFRCLAFARFHFVIGSHYFPFANFDQIVEDIPKAEISTPASLGATPSRAFEP